MKNSVSVTHLKNGRKMFHIDVPGDVSVEELRDLATKAEADYTESFTNACPPYSKSHEIDVDKTYTFQMTGYALKDILAIFNGDDGFNHPKYAKARVFGDRIVVSAACFTKEGEVIPMPHAMILNFKVSDPE